MSTAPCVALLGPRAAGKSTVGRELASRLRVPFVDLDGELEAQHGVPTAELLRTRGEARFREIELAALRAQAERGAHVLATGGGAILTAAARELLRERYVCLTLLAPSEVLTERIRADGGAAVRPPLRGGDPAEEAAAVLAERLPHYLEISHALWSSASRTPAELSEEMELYVRSRLANASQPGAGNGAANAEPRLKLVLDPAAERAVRAGHPWVFRDRIREQNREGRSGELAVIYDRERRFVAAGLFDPRSPIAVRVLQAAEPRTIDEPWWRERLRRSFAAREGLFDAGTNGYRLIHGESDGFPGLVLDRYAEDCVLKIYSGAWFAQLAHLVPLLERELAPRTLLLRTSRNVTVENGLPRDGEALLGTPPQAPVEFSEHGLRFEADLVRGQKTGYFLDQRENRRRAGTLARGRALLNLFSHAGGFSVHAAAGGARSALDVDQSAHALAASERNFARNAEHAAVRAAQHETARADVFAWLRDAPARRFDLVVVDPPALAQRAAEKDGALAAHERLAAGAIERLERHGILVAASCTAHVPAPEFFAAVRRAARRSGRGFRELGTTLHPPDHPARIPEAHYLKCIDLEFGDRQAKPRRHS